MSQGNQAETLRVAAWHMWTMEKRLLECCMTVAANIAGLERLLLDSYRAYDEELAALLLEKEHSKFVGRLLLGHLHCLREY